MEQAIFVHPTFENSWSWTADHFHSLWAKLGPVEFQRLEPDDERPASEVAKDPAQVRKLVCLQVPLTVHCLEAFTALEEVGLAQKPSEELAEALTRRNIQVYRQKSEGFWGQSVSEFGLALTLCALRRIPQSHRAIINRQDWWNYHPEGEHSQPGRRAHQFGDDPEFTNGTVHGKRIRVIGAGNIASRYASFVNALGADVAAWDPYAPEPSFHLAGCRKVHRLVELLPDAEIFAPMVPLTDQTRGLVNAEHIEALPKGCLVVLVTRAGICDMKVLRKRVLAGELSLAADVFDVEPLPLDDPLLGHPNVVHTPHNAGRTKDANFAWAEALANQFRRIPDPNEG